MDFSILYVLQHLHNAVLDRVMVGITSLGNAGWIWIALTAVFLILPKYRKCGVRMAIALILDLILCNLVLKPLAARPRPCWIDEQVKLLVAAPKDYSFPSGHSAASFAAAVSIFVMHKKEGAAALILACLIAFSRLYLFVHFPTDVLAGIAVGFICAFLAAKIQNGFLLHSRVYVVYAPKTFILKFCIGLIAGLIAHKIGKINEQTDQKQIFKWALLAAIGGLLFNVIFDPLIGYFYKLVLLGKPAAEVTLSWNVAATSINAVLSTIASVVIYMALRPALQKSGLFSQVKAAAK